MSLIRNIEDPRFVKQLNGLDHRNQFIRALASVILPQGSGLEGVLSIANRVYDRHCLPKVSFLKPRVDCPEKTALSA